jgi:cyclase
LSPEETAIQAANAGAGEVVIQSIQHDGCMSGYDLETIQKVSELVNIPVIALGGAGSIQDFANAFLNANATGLAAGSFFVFKGAQRGVLINYPASNLRTFVR